MQTGWIHLGNDKWYYLDETGVMQTGWKYEAGIWYYLKDVKGELACNESLVIDGKKYYFDNHGKCTNP